MSEGYTSEIKNFERLRQILSLFYVDGSRIKDDFPLSFYRGGLTFVKNTFDKDDTLVSKRKNGGRAFLSIDSRSYPFNPLYKTFGEKKYNKNDAFLYFRIVDCLKSLGPLSCSQVTEAILTEDISLATVRSKLNEMAGHGMLVSEKIGNNEVFRLSKPLEFVRDSESLVSFFCESAPIGVLGYYLLNDFCPSNENNFIFKHDYINYALDADEMCMILKAVSEKRRISIEYYSNAYKVDNKNEEFEALSVYPIKVFSSTQDGRQFLFCYNYDWNHYDFYRFDKVHNVEILEEDSEYEKHLEFYSQNEKLLWGPALSREPVFFEMTLQVDLEESYIVDRLRREKRFLSFERIDSDHYRVFGEVMYPKGMVTWIRSFWGRICKLECSDPAIKESLLEDLELMKEEYNAL